jgi:hypothetical protein
MKFSHVCQSHRLHRYEYRPAWDTRQFDNFFLFRHTIVMDNATNVGKKALQYRIAMNEIIGVVITVALTAIIAIVLSLIK